MIDPLRALVAQWRARVRGHRVKPPGSKVTLAELNAAYADIQTAVLQCAAELDALLSAPVVSPDVKERISLGLRLGQILGPEYDGVSLEDVARELVTLKTERLSAPVGSPPQEDSIGLDGYCAICYHPLDACRHCDGIASAPRGGGETRPQVEEKDSARLGDVPRVGSPATASTNQPE